MSIAHTGAISYVSKAFGGRTSDKVITQRSDYSDKLEHGDQVLADRGFLIGEELPNQNATLIIPAFTKGKSELSAKEVETTRKIAHVRIHMVPHGDSIVTICSTICNLQPKFVSYAMDICLVIYVLIFKSRQINNFIS